jgi:hypothetical protein
VVYLSFVSESSEFFPSLRSRSSPQVPAKDLVGDKLDTLLLRTIVVGKKEEEDSTRKRLDETSLNPLLFQEK